MPGFSPASPGSDHLWRPRSVKVSVPTILPRFLTSTTAQGAFVTSRRWYWSAWAHVSGLSLSMPSRMRSRAFLGTSSRSGGGAYSGARSASWCGSRSASGMGAHTPHSTTPCGSGGVDGRGAASSALASSASLRICLRSSGLARAIARRDFSLAWSFAFCHVAARSSLKVSQSSSGSSSTCSIGTPAIMRPEVGFWSAFLPAAAALAKDILCRKRIT
mmetsp:Transcript_4043/g.11903  ORF Transcript_4043/g.11903 Transcript_4043/m.11903 type:complete len:217 (+) Transcript_4043:480-1130(+)